MNSILSAVRLLARLKQLHDICLPLGDETGQAARWNALQEWLQLNPDMQAHLDNCLQRAPDEAIDYLLREFSLDASLITQFDPRGDIKAEAMATMERLQTLYKEREHA